MSKTSLIITTYHKDKAMIELTETCLESLKYGRPDEVIVVDDGSPIIKRFSGVKQIFRQDNGGFPKCANTGWKAATGDILILSNNDIIYTPGWLEAIIKPLNEGYDISSVVMSDRTWETRDEITEGDFFGSLWAMKREVYDKIGGFDERFTKGCFEDKDYHIRARKAGFKIGKNHAVVVEHYGRATMRTIYPNEEDFNESARIFEDKWGFLV